MKAAALDARRARLALNDLAALPARRAPLRSLLPRCWELRDNLTIYDAAYVTLAEAMNTTLVTGDRKLTRAPGPQCPIESPSSHPDLEGSERALLAQEGAMARTNHRASGVQRTP